MKNKIRRIHGPIFSMAIGWAIAIAFCLRVPILVAGDFWKEKKASDWSEQEARRMISQSPWAKQTRVKFNIAGPSGRPTGRN